MIVDLMPTEEQAAIRDSIAAVVAEEFPVARLHQTDSFGAGREAACWSLLTELGVFAMGVAEERGGVGFGLPEEVTIARELGRGLVSPTVLATIAASHLAEGALFEDIRDGRKRVAFANPMVPFEGLRGKIAVQLIDAREADYVLVWNDRMGALYARPDETVPTPALDDTILLERASLDVACPIFVSEGPQVARRCGLMLSAYLAAVAEGAMTLAVDYAKVREQFGQPIGAFQAIKHYSAEMALHVEAAVSQTFFATLDAVDRFDDDMGEVAAARLLANEAAAFNGRTGVQIHGGMGFTYEADAHFYLKRGLLVSKIASNARVEQSRIIASAGLA